MTDSNECDANDGGNQVVKTSSRVCGRELMDGGVNRAAAFVPQNAGKAPSPKPRGGAAVLKVIGRQSSRGWGRVGRGRPAQGSAGSSKPGPRAAGRTSLNPSLSPSPSSPHRHASPPTLRSLFKLLHPLLLLLHLLLVLLLPQSTFTAE